MWNNYKKRLKALVKENRDNQKNSELFQQDQIAITQLLKMFNDEFFVPITRWSLPPRELLHVCNDILLNKRKNIIEFGTGYSTIFICKFIQINKLKVDFISVDNDNMWQNTISDILNNLDLLYEVRLVLAPVEDVNERILHSNQTKWYDSQILDKQLHSVNKIDLVIVDGPHGSECQYSRYSAIPYLKNKLTDNFCIFLDNTNRIQEFEIAKNWKKDLNCNIKNYSTYCHLTLGSSIITAPYGVKPKGWK